MEGWLKLLRTGETTKIAKRGSLKQVWAWKADAAARNQQLNGIYPWTYDCSSPAYHYHLGGKHKRSQPQTRLNSRLVPDLSKVRGQSISRTYQWALVLLGGNQRSKARLPCAADIPGLILHWSTGNNINESLFSYEWIKVDELVWWTCRTMPSHRSWWTCRQWLGCTRACTAEQEF